MATPQENIDKLETAMAKGIKSVMINGERVEYQDIAQMIQAREVFTAQLRAQGTSRTSYAAFEND
jgi:putative heme iron utilization protein